eukprot:72736_1
MTTEGSHLCSKEEVQCWLKNTVELEQYTKQFIDHGFESLNLVKEINNKNDLESMGITNFAHQLRIMNQIHKLKQLNFENELELIYQPSAPLLTDHHHDNSNNNDTQDLNGEDNKGYIPKHQTSNCNEIICIQSKDSRSKDDYADNQSNDLPKDEGDTSHKKSAQTSGRLCFAVINILAILLWIIAILCDNLSVYSDSTRYSTYRTSCGWTQWSVSDNGGYDYSPNHLEYAKCCNYINDENIVLISIYRNEKFYGELTHLLSHDCCVTDTVAKNTLTTLILAILSSLFSLLFLQKTILKRVVIKCYFCAYILTGLSIIFSLMSISIWFAGNKICDDKYVADKHYQGFQPGGTMIVTIIATVLIGVGEGIAVWVAHSRSNKQVE